MKSLTGYVCECECVRACVCVRVCACACVLARVCAVVGMWVVDVDAQ